MTHVNARAYPVKPFVPYEDQRTCRTLRCAKSWKRHDYGTELGSLS